jgi:hypothetical protein
MAETLTIPTRTDLPNYEEEVSLVGEVFVFSFQWSQREARWYFDLYDATRSPIARGIKVVVGWPLLRLVRDRRRPKGEIVAIDTTNSDRGPGLDELGGRVILTFTPDA